MWEGYFFGVNSLHETDFVLHLNHGKKSGRVMVSASEGFI
jgi:hypothetical protein